MNVLSLYLAVRLWINVGSGECGLSPCIIGFIQCRSTADLVLHSFSNGFLMRHTGHCNVHPPQSCSF